MSFLNAHNNLDHSNQFKKIADKITVIAQKYSVTVKGYHSSDLPLFSSLPTEKQQQVLDQLSIFLKSMEITEGSGDRLDNEEKSLWSALSTFGFVPPSDLFNRFEFDDAVEIYDLEGMQIWRNLNCMKMCSYTLEEVYSLEWFKRYKRDPKISEDCQARIGSLLMGLTPDIYTLDLAEHLVEETASVEGLVLSLRHGWIARFKNSSSQLAGWMVASKGTIVDRHRPKLPPQRLLQLVESFPHSPQP